MLLVKQQQDENTELRTRVSELESTHAMTQNRLNKFIVTNNIQKGDIEHLRQVLASKDTTSDEIEDLRVWLADCDRMIASKDRRIAFLDVKIASNDAMLAYKDTMIACKDARIAYKDIMIASNDAMIASLNGSLNFTNALLAQTQERSVRRDKEYDDGLLENRQLRSERLQLQYQIAELQSTIFLLQFKLRSTSSW